MNHCKCSELQWWKQQIQNSGLFMRIFFYYSSKIIDSWVSETYIHILTPITGKSLSEALIFVEHRENMLCK